MANELRIADGTGLTYTCEVRQPDGTLIGSPVTLTESGSSGRYYGDMPAAGAGVYDLVYIQNSIIEATEAVSWSGTAILSLSDALTATGFSTHTAADVRTEMDSNSTQLAALIVDTGTDIPGAIAALNDLSAAQIATELATYDGPTKAELDAAQATITGAIAALNDLSAAQIATELATYDGPTKAELDAAQATITGAIAALNDLSAAQVATELATYDGPTKAELDAAQATITGAIAALNDLSAADIDARLAAATVDANIVSVTDTAVTDVTDFYGPGATLTADEIAQKIVNQTASVTVVNPLSSSGDLSLLSTTTNSWTVTASIPSNYNKIVFTVKRRLTDSDADAIIQASDTHGLTVLNGAAYATTGNATLTVDDEAGTVNIKLRDDAAALLSDAVRLFYDVKCLYAGGDSKILAHGQCSVKSTATREI